MAHRSPALWTVIPILAIVMPLCAADDHMPGYWPGATIDRDIPSLESIVGHDHGEEITSPEQIAAYLSALADAAPARTKLVEYARSFEDRPLHYLVIGSRDNISRLDEIKRTMQRLASGTSDDVPANLPAIVWASHGVHGDEISSSDSALLLARYLLAADDDAFREILSNVLVVIDPMQNPDGRARFVHHYRQTRGIEPAPSSIAAERRQGWPSGRTNHYLFDMNRDWFALTQPETRGRVASLLEYYPLVHIDVHEMGTNSTYYFPPPAKPFNPHITDAQKQGLDTLGRGMASQFDRFGFDYFTREVYDALYPGYGDTWPMLHGSLGMTFEMASARGLVGERDDGSLVTYDDGVHRHFVATMGTLLTAARERRALLENFVAYRRSATEDRNVYAFSTSTNDPAMVHLLGDKLTMQGIDVEAAAEEVRICGETMPAGSLIVRAGQGAGRLVRTLLDANSPMREAFLAEQERRRAKGLGAELYDVLGWSMPALFSMETASCTGSVRGDTASYSGPTQKGAPADANVAWLIPWDSRASARFLTHALRQGITIHSTDKPFTQRGRTFPAGTLIIKRNANADDVHADVIAVAASSNAEVIATDSSWTDAGSNFGAEFVLEVNPPRIAMAWDEPVSQYSAGAARYVLERQFDYPVTPVRVRDLDDPALAAFDVLIVPHGYYGSGLRESVADNIASWVESGGTLIGFEGALRGFASAGWLDTAREYRYQPESTETTTEEDEARVPGTVVESETAYREFIAPVNASPDDIPGVLMRGIVDPDHWLGAGSKSQVNFMVGGTDVWRPLTRDAGTNVVRFAAADELVAGGHLWEENRAQWAFKPAVMATRKGNGGTIIGFTSEPTFRAFVSGLDMLFINAVFRSSPLRED